MSADCHTGLKCSRGLRTTAPNNSFGRPDEVVIDGRRLDAVRPVVDSHTRPGCGRSGAADRCGRMRPTGTSEAALVVAAQAGDRDAVDELVTTYLPLVYNAVGRAVGPRSDVDDIVQDTMLRALRDLPALRTPESFRAWLLTIAVRQVGTYRHRRTADSARTAMLDEAADIADDDFDDLAILRLGLSGQRGQAARAGRWLDPDNRTVLSLWWLEAAGHLSRTDLAAALGSTVAHAGVRVQRMRDQFDVCRAVVVGLEAGPRCSGLDAVLVG